MKCIVTCANARSYSAAASSLKLSSSGIPGSLLLGVEGTFSASRSLEARSGNRAAFLVVAEVAFGSN
jgi:hypothetical protein